MEISAQLHHITNGHCRSWSLQIAVSVFALSARWGHLLWWLLVLVFLK